MMFVALATSLPDGTIKPVGHVKQVTIQSTSADNPVPLVLTMIRLEQLAVARFVPPLAIELEFVDGLKGSLAIGLLDMPLDRMNWPTLEVSPAGDKAIVKGIKGDPVPIDSATLRYLVDKAYKARIDATLKNLQFTDEELENLSLNDPPPGFLEQPDSDLTRESWK